jgi:GNAT superfamily N-acetyltransferase
MRPELVITETPDADMRKAILDPLVAYNDRHFVEPDAHRPLAIPIRDSSGQAVIGGLWGESWYRWLFINLLIVPESMRGIGIGKAMMKLAEEEAIRRDCIGIWLDTFSFQARPFYEQLGFELFGTIEDFPPGHSRHFLRKVLLKAR